MGEVVAMRPSWHAQLTWSRSSKTPRLVKSLSNVVAILDNDGRHGLQLRELEGGMGRILDGDREVASIIELVPALQHWLANSEHDLEVGHDLILTALPIVARRHLVSPIREYLTGLKWDGKLRLPTWLSVYGGCDDSPLSQRIGAWWMQQAAARGLKPGCKADYCLILDGEQGLGKSTLLRALVPRSEWFTDSITQLKEKDDKLLLAGCWIAELAEITALGSSRVEHLKAALTQPTDLIRPPYKPHAEPFPRSCVFAGTTNQRQYLNDETGGRRFWPVTVVRRPDIAALVRDRDQLWAEAVERERRGIQRWPEYGDTLFAEAQEARRNELPWESELSTYLVGRGDFVTTTQLLGTLQIPSDRQNQSTLKALSTVMRALGWEPHRSASSRGYRRIA